MRILCLVAAIFAAGPLAAENERERMLEQVRHVEAQLDQAIRQLEGHLENADVDRPQGFDLAVTTGRDAVRHAREAIEDGAEGRQVWPLTNRANAVANGISSVGHALNRMVQAPGRFPGLGKNPVMQAYRAELEQGYQRLGDQLLELANGTVEQLHHDQVSAKKIEILEGLLQIEQTERQARVYRGDLPDDHPLRQRYETYLGKLRKALAADLAEVENGTPPDAVSVTHQRLQHLWQWTTAFHDEARKGQIREQNPQVIETGTWKKWLAKVGEHREVLDAIATIVTDPDVVLDYQGHAELQELQERLTALSETKQELQQALESILQGEAYLEGVDQALSGLPDGIDAAPLRERRDALAEELAAAMEAVHRQDEDDRLAALRARNEVARIQAMIQFLSEEIYLEQNLAADLADLKRRAKAGGAVEDLADLEAAIAGARESFETYREAYLEQLAINRTYEELNLRQAEVTERQQEANEERYEHTQKAQQLMQKLRNLEPAGGDGDDEGMERF